MGGRVSQVWKKQGLVKKLKNQIHANNVTSKHGSTVFSNLPLQLNKACFNTFLVSDSGKKLMMLFQEAKVSTRVAVHPGVYNGCV